MPDYEPIDLSEHLTGGLDALGTGVAADIGPRHFRGLPFVIGDDPSRCFISLDGDSERVTVPVGRSASRIIFAHRLLTSDIDAGGPVGVHVADYVFSLANGRHQIAPIRERFEIGVVPTDSFQGASGLPFRAVTDGKHRLMPRKEGQWQEVGRRQTEYLQATARSYFLWCWTNPEPDVPVETIQIIPNGPAFVIAGVTLSHVDEHPFARQGRREAKITITDPVLASSAFDIEVDVDRGDSTYAFPLPKDPGDSFLTGYHQGFGEQPNDDASPSYAEISAVPSATVSVRQNGETIAQLPWGEVEEKGHAETPKVRMELADRGRNWVKVTVVDDDTGRPIPCRVHFRSPDGIPYQPHGHHNQVNSNLDSWHIDVGGDVRMGQITYAYIDGRCEGWLPRGDVIVDVARGFEYEPLRTMVRIEPGQQRLELRIKRWVDMNARRWFSGDSHVHFLSTQGAHMESSGEDLNVVNLLQSQWGSLFTNTEDFTGRASVVQNGKNIVYVSQENRQHFMGHMILWGLKEPVMPWCSDGPGEAEIGGHMETTLAHWADEAHAQGAWVINPHFPNPNGEPAALVATGRLDGVEMLRQTRPNHMEYYRYLNCGYRLPLVGGTDKMSSDVPVGLYRTYALLPDDQDFNYENWCRSVAAGRTFLSGGPIIHLSVDGKEVGDTLAISGPGSVEVEAWSESVLPIYSLEIVQNGKVVARTDSRTGARRLELKEKVRIDNHSWIAARTGAFDYFEIVQHHDVWNRGVFAHTSPVYVACGGEWDMFDSATAQYMLTLIDGDLTYIRETAGVRPIGTVTHRHGEADHLAYLERPFLEARDAILSRMK